MYFSKILVLCTLLVSFISLTELALAHELLPQSVISFIEANPNATPEELQSFAATQNPAVAAKITDKSTSDLLRLVQDQDNGFWHNIWDFIQLGVHHILSGADHILFVFTLLLVFTSLREIFMLVTTFTIAHSLTILLAGTGLLVLSSSIVEPIIALSIAVMALLTVFFRDQQLMRNNKAKTALVFFFGLFHGLGFAGLLQEISIPANKFVSSLLAFNIGIEVGQLIIILVAIPILIYLKKYSWYDTAIKIAAVLISIIALVWFLQRILGT